MRKTLEKVCLKKTSCFNHFFKCFRKQSACPCSWNRGEQTKAWGASVLNSNYQKGI